MSTANPARHSYDLGQRSKRTSFTLMTDEHVSSCDSQKQPVRCILVAACSDFLPGGGAASASTPSFHQTQFKINSNFRTFRGGDAALANLRRYLLPAGNTISDKMQDDWLPFILYGPHPGRYDITHCQVSGSLFTAQ